MIEYFPQVTCILDVSPFRELPKLGREGRWYLNRDAYAGRPIIVAMSGVGGSQHGGRGGQATHYAPARHANRALLHGFQQGPVPRGTQLVQLVSAANPAVR